MSKEELAEIKIPKAMADSIREHPRFKVCYRDLDDFAADAMRRLVESWKGGQPNG